MSAPRVEALRSVARDPGLVRVMVDGGCVGELRREHAAELGVREGAPWTRALERRVRETIDHDACRSDALRRLGRRDMTRALLTRRLTAKWDAALAERVTAELAKEGWLDDGAYAQRRAEALQRRAPLATEALQARLEAEGVRAPVARRAARTARPGERLDLQVRQWKTRGRDAASVARALGRQGFDSDTILQALRRAGFECEAFD